MFIETFSLKYDELVIRRNSLLAAMGYAPGPAPVVDGLVDEILESGGGLCDIQGGYRIVEAAKLDRKDFNLSLEHISLSIHKVVFSQLKGSDRVAVFVCTAGRQIAEQAKALMQAGDLLKGYVYDIFGSFVVESAMDIVQGRLQEKMKGAGLKITNRYSPGYCGWEITEQKRLFSLLPEHFCGIELTDSCLMLPTKSISGIIGIGESVKFNQYTCNMCDARNCMYKNLARETHNN